MTILNQEHTSVYRGTWSLSNLHIALQQRLSPAPSLATLKLWSRMGYIQKGVPLQVAIEHICAEIGRGALRVRGPRSSATMERGLVALPAPGIQGSVGTADRVVASASAALDEDLRQALRQTVLEAVRDVLRDSAHQDQPMQTLREASEDDERSRAALHQMLRAVDILESVRRHILVQWDALRTAQKAAAHAGAGGSDGSEVDILTMHRLLARMSRLEEAMQRLAEKVDSVAQSLHDLVAKP